MSTYSLQKEALLHERSDLFNKLQICNDDLRASLCVKAPTGTALTHVELFKKRQPLLYKKKAISDRLEQVRKSLSIIADLEENEAVFKGQVPREVLIKALEDWRDEASYHLAHPGLDDDGGYSFQQVMDRIATIFGNLVAYAPATTLPARGNR